MLVNTVSQILQMSVGAAPEAVKGVLRSLQKQIFFGEGEKRSSIQRGKLLGADNAEIELVMFGRAPLDPNLIGAEIYITATKGARGMTGLKRAENEYNGKTTQQLTISDKAEIAAEEGGGESDQQQPSQQQQPPPKTQQPGQQSQPQNHQQQQAAAPEEEAKKLKIVRKAAMKLRNLHLLSLRAALSSFSALEEECKTANKPVPEFTGEDVQSAAATIFIQLARAEMHLNLPDHPLPPPTPKAEKK